MRHKIDNIQILRAVAALGVVLVHTGFSWGRLRVFGGFGVDIFFVISGFIMTMICSSNPRSFMTKRLVRIVPLYWAVTLLTFFLLKLNPTIEPEWRRDGAALLQSLLFVPYRELNQGLSPMLPPGWSLNSEIFFYCVLAFAILLWPRKPAIPGFATLGVLVLILHPFGGRNLYAFFYGNYVMLEFVAGYFAYRIFMWAPVEACVRLRPALYLTLAAGFCYIIWYEGIYYYLPDGTSRSHLGLGIPAFFILQSAVLLSKSGRDVRWRFGVLLGDASYSLYLTHMFVLSTFKHTFSRISPLLASDRALGMCATLLVATGVALAVHVYLDNPVHTYLSRRLTSARRLPS